MRSASCAHALTLINKNTFTNLPDISITIFLKALWYIRLLLTSQYNKEIASSFCKAMLNSRECSKVSTPSNSDVCINVKFQMNKSFTNDFAVGLPYADSIRYGNFFTPLRHFEMKLQRPAFSFRVVWIKFISFMFNCWVSMI